MSDGEILERLIVQFEARADKLADQLNGVGRTIHSHTGKWQKEADGIDLGRFINTSFSSARLRLLEEGGARIGFLGAGLDHLGTAGLAAAAGIAAVTVATEGVIKAAEWAEDLQVTAERLGITTTKLQEYDFLAIKSGVSTQTMRASLEGLNEVLGRVQAGVSPRQAKLFAALGFTREELRGFQDATELLPKLADAINSLPTAAAREGIAKGLDISAILPALREGSAGINRLIEDMHRFGIIADENLIRKGAEAADQLRATGAVIHDELNVALLELSPLLTQAAEKLADVAHSVADLAKYIQNNWGWISKLVAAMQFMANPLGEGVKAIAHMPHELTDPVAAEGRRIRDALFGTRTELPGALEAVDPDAARAGAGLGGMIGRRSAAPHWLDTGNGGGGGGGGARASRNARGDLTVSVTVPKEAMDTGASIRDWGTYERLQAAGIKSPIGIGPDQTLHTPGNLKDNPMIAALNDAKLLSDEQLASMHDRLANTFSDAMDAGLRGGWPGLLQYLGQSLERVLVNNLASGLASAFTSGGNNIFGALLHLIPGFAEGTDFAPGGLSLVGERGPELLNIPRGSVITPNAAMMRGGGGVQNFFDLRGSITTAEFMAQINGTIADSHRSAVVQGAVAGASAARSLVPAEMARRAAWALR